MCVENISVCPRYLCFGKHSSCSYFSVLRKLLNAQVGVLQQQLVSGVVPAEVSEPRQVISSKSDKDEMGLIFIFFFFFGEVQLFSLSSFFPPFKIIFLVLADQWWSYICSRWQPKFLKLRDFKIVGHCCKMFWLFVHGTAASPMTRGPRTSILEKHSNLVLVLRENLPCWLACTNPWCFAWVLGDSLCAVWSLGTKRGEATLKPLPDAWADWGKVLGPHQGWCGETRRWQENVNFPVRTNFSQLLGICYECMFESCFRCFSPFAPLCL